ncbi:MAG: universal stress protein [Acidobacteriota bacterium]|nr:universal stress protein [Acidobacteriota bacterium]
MVEFTRILCPSDLSELSLPPLAHAVALARWYKAQLTVLHVVPTFEPLVAGAATLGGPVQVVYPVSREDILTALRRAVDDVGGASLDVALVADAGDTARTIIDRAGAVSADLLVVGTHGRGGFERFFIGSVAEKVLRKAPCPVLTVPPQAGVGSPPEVHFKNILCPMDFSPSALHAFGFAVDLARQAGGTVTVLHVIESLPDDAPSPYAHYSVPEYREHLVDDARQRLHALIAEEPRTGGAILDRVEHGRPHREILRTAAETPADLIVMGAQGRGGLDLALFGSTTQTVVRAAPCPVLTVRMQDPSRMA